MYLDITVRYNNIETPAALIKRVLKFNLTFGDLNIDFTLAKLTQHPSLRQPAYTIGVVLFLMSNS